MAGPALISANSTWAGLYGPSAVITVNGQAVSNASVTVQSLDATGSVVSNFTQYADYARTPYTGPSLTTDDQGNLTFWTDPGYYQVDVVGFSVAPFVVVVSPFYADATLNAVSNPSSFTTVSGDVNIVDASSAPKTITLPDSRAGSHVKVVKTGGFPVTVNTNDGHTIFGPGLGTGYGPQPQMIIYGNGGALEFVSDGTNYHLTGTNTRRVGIVEMFAGSTATIPAGAFLCNGQSLARTDYPDLFEVIGGLYGYPDADHFYVPNFTPSGTHLSPIAGTPGTSYGAASYTLQDIDLPNHTHNAASGFEFVVGITTGQNNSVNDTPGGSSGPTGVTFTNYTGDSTVGQSHSVPTITPSLGINFIIWAQ